MGGAARARAFTTESRMNAPKPTSSLLSSTKPPPMVTTAAARPRQCISVTFWQVCIYTEKTENSFH